MRAALGLVVVLGLSGAGCSERPAAPAVESITVAVGALPHFSMVYVALAKGYFAEEGLKVTLQPYPFGKLALAAVLDGQADLAACAETPVVFAELRGQHLSVLASISRAKRSMAVVARKDAAIAVPADLASRRVGVTFGTSGDFFLDTFLLRHHVERTRMRILDLEPEGMQEALEAGAVDAVAIWNPTALVLQRHFGGRAQSFYEEDLYFETAVIVGRRGFAASRPEASRRLLRALLRAERLFRERPEEARGLVATALRDDSGLLADMMVQLEFQVRLDQSLLVALEEEGRWARRLRPVAVQDTLNFLETLDPAPLLAVRPERVGLIR